MFSALVCGVLEGGTSIRGYVCFDVDGSESYPQAISDGQIRDLLLHVRSSFTHAIPAI